MWQKWNSEIYFSTALIWKSASMSFKKLWHHWSRIRRLIFFSWIIIFRMLKNKEHFCQNLTVPWFTCAFQKLCLCHLTFWLPNCCWVGIILELFLPFFPLFLGCLPLPCIEKLAVVYLKSVDLGRLHPANKKSVC